MSGKKVTFGAKPTKPAPSADAWVESRAVEEAPPSPVEKMKRLTIDIPESLHKAIKSACALRAPRLPMRCASCYMINTEKSILYLLFYDYAILRLNVFAFMVRR
ncbi:Uncharacterised protein [Klebsiella pneumoniae]|uniref:Uncharacterized protein n=1 Tax=Klebsiella pneumoniae TaxID=573 RepID=A0A377YT61_KLEPN|nr:Uncharacterised protein [Klebsiella pneumoniae]